MKQFPISQSCRLVVQSGDITTMEVDAIVNAANERMLGGMGVDGAIHLQAGPQLLEACRAVPEVSSGVRCPRGEARLTDAFNLPSRYVIHTVGPIYESASVSRPILASAYRNSLALAQAQELSSIAFPAISCGVYGYPLESAAAVAVETCLDHHGSLSEVRMVLFGTQTYERWLAVTESVLLERQQGN